MRLSHRQRSPPGWAVSPPSLVPLTNCARLLPSSRIATRSARPEALRSGWKFSVTRRSPSTGGPQGSAATWFSARTCAGVSATVGPSEDRGLLDDVEAGEHGIQQQHDRGGNEADEHHERVE